MSKIISSDGMTSITEEFKEHNSKKTLSKKDDELFHEEDDIVFPVIRIKYFSSSNTCSWKIFDNNKVIFIVDGNKLTNKEKNYLKTVEGVNFLIKEFKNGINSFNSLKKAIAINLQSKRS